jgi:hypothetical protein
VASAFLKTGTLTSAWLIGDAIYDRLPEPLLNPRRQGFITTCCIQQGGSGQRFRHESGLCSNFFGALSPIPHVVSYPLGPDSLGSASQILNLNIVGGWVRPTLGILDMNIIGGPARRILGILGHAVGHRLNGNRVETSRHFRALTPHSPVF